MSNDTEIYTLKDFDTEVSRQRAKFRLAYIMRWLVGWPKIAFLLGRRKAGWYLVRGGTVSQLCYTVGPFNTKSQARAVNSGYPSGYFGFAYVILLWQEPLYNQDRGYREFARPWYRFPARGR